LGLWGYDEAGVGYWRGILDTIQQRYF